MQLTWHQATQPSDTRLRLLTVAADLVHKQGFFKTSLDEIATDADIAKATIYHHFKNKEELGHELIQFNTARYLAFLKEKVFVKEVTGLRRLRDLCSAVIEEFATGGLDRGCPICNLVSELSNVKDAYRRPLEDFFTAYRQLIVEALRDAKERGEIVLKQDFADIACLFLTQLQGGVLLARAAIRGDDRSAGVTLLQQTTDAFFALLNPNEGASAVSTYVRKTKAN